MAAWVLRLALLLGMGSCVAGRALAADGPWHLQLEALTDVPLDVGGRLVLEGPARLRLSTSLGVLPGFYADLIDDFLVDIGAINQETGQLIDSSLQSSLVWRTHLGWRPFPAHGFVFDVGFGLVTLGGSANGASVVAAALGKTTTAAPSAASYQVASTLEMIDADLGWQWLLWANHLVIEASLGFSGTLGAQTTATPATVVRKGKLQDAFGSAAAEYLDRTYTSYVFTPVATLALGYRFF